MAATVIPFSSEAHFALVVTKDNFIVAIIAATLGNTLGGLSSYYLGWLAKWYWIEKYLKVRPEKANKLKSRIQKHGGWLGFLCWMPFIGDLFAVALGVFRASFALTTITMFTGKTIRYIIISYIII